MATLAAASDFGDCGGGFPVLVLCASTAVSQSGAWFAGGYRAGGVVEWSRAFVGNGRGHSQTKNEHKVKKTGLSLKRKRPGP